MKNILLFLVLPLFGLAEENAANLSAIRLTRSKLQDEKQILESAEARIQQYRTGRAEITVVDQNGQPLKNAAIHVRLVKHEFKLGCNAFLLGAVVGEAVDPTLCGLYEQRFAALLNYATLPFYWGMYEPVKGQTKEAEVRHMAAWCQAHDIEMKGHPLAWHEVFPAWAKTMPDAEVMALQRKRTAGIVSGFKDSIRIFDAINEATVSAKFDNAIGREIKARGAAAVAAEVIGIAHRANPEAKLLYNDFNVSADFEKLAAELEQMKAPVDALGIQSHMHKELWPMEKLWAVCETYARFGKPLHFTELTILSGDFKARDDDDWHTVRTGWNTTPTGEQRQLEYGQKLYTILFSHPAVEAITWWDFSDLKSWAGAPSGLLRKDMSPKPLYNWLENAFHRKWSTDVVVKSDAAGRIELQAFYGKYEVTAKNGAGAELGTQLVFAKNGPRKLQAVVK